MAPTIQVKVCSTQVASFGGVDLRRVAVAVGEQQCVLLVRETLQGSPYVLQEGAAGAAPPLMLRAEWGEPLAPVQALEAGEDGGRVSAYLLEFALPGGEVYRTRIRTRDTYWWQGQLYCRKSRTLQLRDSLRARRNGPGDRAA
ncbi:hypothetical protein [Deinococcus hohokamensis]|uniref:Uncharacterized protein n=1 Tax=Deinococcus hohokamensis TaxID=309883 RepID=A0ABV9I8I2_9DEIO